MTTKSSPTTLLWLCGAMAFASFLLLFHNFGLALIPDRELVIARNEIQPLADGTSHGYVFAFDSSEADRPQNQRSRVQLFENGQPHFQKILLGPHMAAVRHGRWLHSPGYIIFSASDNSDPRVNGRTYALRYSPLYSAEIGLLAACVFCVSVFGLYWLTRHQAAPVAQEPNPISPWRWHVIGAGLVFIAGLYCNTGTLAPYANTFESLVDPTTGYLYNIDHQVFRMLYDFVNGGDRSLWDHALLLRRILYPVLAWPFMRLGGFEWGGVIASLVFNAVGFLVSIHLIRARIGERGARFAAWLLALYPGAAYWAGLPYTYVMIFPCSMLLMLGLMQLSATDRWSNLIFVSVGMGLAYLAYDLAPFFIPATLLTLAWQRRWLPLLTTAALQVTPTILWLVCLKVVFLQSSVNSNTSALGVIIQSYLHPGDPAEWWALAARAPDIGWDVFFGANFIFLPALFLAVLAFNAITSRIKLTVAESALLVAALGLFLFSNLAPNFSAEWKLRGAWISRLYQPVFPVFIIFLARWWQCLPSLSRAKSILIGTTLLAAAAGNVLIIFGPIADNPLHVSGEAFYRFYTHTDQLWWHPYEMNLKQYGRRPLGFPKSQP